MLPLRWKIFKVLNYIQLVYSIGLAGFITYAAVFRYRRPDSSPIPYIFIIGFVVMAATSFFNIFITDRHLPDKPLLRGINAFHYSSLISAVVISLAFLLLLIAGISDLSQSGFQPFFAWFILSVLFIIWLIHLLITIRQFQLKPFIRKNYNKNFISLIDSIGKT